VILSAVNQQYVEGLSESVKHGLRAKMLRGELVGDPETLGYDKDKETGKLVINEAEQRLFAIYSGVILKEQVAE